MGIYQGLIDQIIAEDFKFTNSLAIYILQIAKHKFKDEDDRQEFTTTLLELIQNRKVKSLIALRKATLRAFWETKDRKQKIDLNDAKIFCGSCKRFTKSGNAYTLKINCKHCGDYNWQFLPNKVTPEALYMLTHENSFDKEKSSSIFSAFNNLDHDLLKNKKIDWATEFLTRFTKNLKASKNFPDFLKPQILKAVNEYRPVRSYRTYRAVSKSDPFLLPEKYNDALHDLVYKTIEEIEEVTP